MLILSTFAIFAKFWEKGKVKTRLAQTIGFEAAAKLYQLFLKVSVNKAEDWTGPKVICYSPPEKEDEFRQLAPDWSLIPQEGSDLGERMKNLFDSVLEPSAPQSHVRSSQSLILIGSDSPLMPKEYLTEAKEKLARNDVVIGPSQDGGYYLIGARGKTPEIFDDIEWSTGNVFAQTIDRLRSGGYQYDLLDTHRDIDDDSDLRWMIEQLKRRDDLPRDMRTILRESLHYLQQSSTDPFV